MENGWAERLWEVIDADPRSERAISLAAGHGPNYLSQSRKKGTSPNSGKLASVLDVLGPEAMLYIYTGLRFTDEDRQFLLTLQTMTPELKRAALQLFEQLQAGAAPLVPGASDPA